MSCNTARLMHLQKLQLSDNPSFDGLMDNRNSENKTTLIIETGGNYMTGEFAKKRELKELTIVGKPTNVTLTDPLTKVAKVKVQAKIKYAGQNKEDPDTWTMNSTSAKILGKKFGLEESNWENKKIPIEVSRTEKGYAIYADEMKLGATL